MAVTMPTRKSPLPMAKMVPRGQIGAQKAAHAQGMRARVRAKESKPIAESYQSNAQCLRARI